MGCVAQRWHDRIAWALEQFELEPLMRQPSGLLPGGYKQRLAMAAALLHEPEILFLDEPTSGADPLARREFWRRITALAEQGVTVIVTTHFMEEAEYCDHVVIQDHGRVLAHGTPAEIRRYAPVEKGRETRMEDAFIAIVEAGRRIGAEPPVQSASRSPTSIYTRPYNQFERQDRTDLDTRQKRSAANPPRPEQYRRRHGDASVLILLFGFGLTLDVKNVPVAVRTGGHFSRRSRTGFDVSAFPLFSCKADDLDGPGARAHSREPSRWHHPHPAPTSRGR